MSRRPVAGFAAGFGMRGERGHVVAAVPRISRYNPDMPMVLFGYANPIFGAAPSSCRPSQAGCHSLCVELAARNAKIPRAGPGPLPSQGLDLIPLNRTYFHPRAGESSSRGCGRFLIYYVSLTGITGSQLPNLDEHPLG